MSSRTASYVVRFGLAIIVLCAVASVAVHIFGEPKNDAETWGDEIVAMGMMPLCFASIVVQEWRLNLPGLTMLALYVGSVLGLTVAAVGGAMGVARKYAREGPPGLGRWVILIGALLAGSCAAAAYFTFTTDLINPFTDPLGFGWATDQLFPTQAICMAGAFIGFNITVTGLVMSAALSLGAMEEPLERRMTVRQARYAALIGLGIALLFVEANVITDAANLDFLVFLLFAAGAFVGIVAWIVGLVVMCRLAWRSVTGITIRSIARQAGV